MNISKSLRFEVLRRDGFACRYCGAKSYDAELHVDHVLPQSLGGTDDPTNLVTACADCNAGKGSTPPDAPMVADVQALHLRWRDAVAQAAIESEADDGYIANEVVRVFGNLIDVPYADHAAFKKLNQDGLPMRAIVGACRIAMSTKHVPYKSKVAYAKGICRRELADLHARAAEIIKDGE